MSQFSIADLAQVLKKKIKECTELQFSEDEIYAHGVIAILETIKEELEVEEKEASKQEQPQLMNREEANVYDNGLLVE